MQKRIDEISERFETWYHNLCLGELLLDDFRTGGFRPKKLEELTDEEFETLAVDLGISDVSMAELFEVSKYAIKKRRNAIGIPRGSALLNRWFHSGREDVDMSPFVKQISA